MRLFTICLVIQSLVFPLFSSPIPVQETFKEMYFFPLVFASIAYGITCSREAPWFLSSLTADPSESKAIDKSATGPFFYRELTGVNVVVNIYYVGARVNIQADDVKDFAHVLEVYEKGDNLKRYPVNLQATYAAALAIGKQWGIAKGAHLYSLPILKDNKFYSSTALVAGIHKILDHCKILPQSQKKRLCIVALPHVLFISNDIRDGLDKVRAPTRQRSLNNAIIKVAPVDEKYTKSDDRISKCLWVTAANIEIPLSSEPEFEVHMWMAAVLRASGIVASFVYQTWLQNSRPPSPGDILKAIKRAAFTPIGKRGLKVLHIPPEVSGRLIPPTPYQMFNTFRLDTSVQRPHLTPAPASQLTANSTHQTGLDINGVVSPAAGVQSTHDHVQPTTPPAPLTNVRTGFGRRIAVGDLIS